MMRTVSAALCGLVLSMSPLTAQQIPVQPAGPAPKPADAATSAAARRLLVASGATRLVISSMESMIASQREANPQIPAAFWDAFMAHAKRDTTRLMDMLVPIYAAHLTQTDLEELIKFYQSPAGQRFIAAQPRIVQESQQAGQSWGEMIARLVGDSLQKSQGNAPPER
jgi:uncharacterized protein